MQNLPGSPSLDFMPAAIAEAKSCQEETTSPQRSGLMEPVGLESLLGAGVLSPKRLEARLNRQMRRCLKRLDDRVERGLRTSRQAPVAKYLGLPVWGAFDAEWLTIPDGKGGHRNEVLCITAVIQCGGGTTRFVFWPSGPLRSDRPTLAGFWRKALRSALCEGTIPSMPDQITIFSHFIRGDLASFSDFWSHRHEFRGLGKTLASGFAGHLLAEDGPDPEGEKGAGEPPLAGSDIGGDDIESRDQAIVVRSPGGRAFAVRARFIDTIKLTPAQRGLAYAAKMVGMRKLDLHTDLGIPEIETVERPECLGLGLKPRYGKDRMDLVMRDYPKEGLEYAYQDTEVALAYGLFMVQMARDQFMLPRLPNTIAACAAAMVARSVGGGAALADLIGRSTVSRSFFDEKRRTYRTIKSSMIKPALEIFYKFASNSYHGGRNECFYHGPTSVGMWYDYDLPGAYTTALAALRPIDYDRIYSERDPAAYGIDDMGFALITFEFPVGTRFPCLPVRGALGALFFPLSGRREDNVYVGSPEIYLARQMGAKIEIIQGIKAPWLSDKRIFEPFTLLVQTKRREFPKATHAAVNELWKECGNSGYGLLAQGLKGKNAFDPRTMRAQPIGPSQLTEPFLAAYATSFIRAVLGEILSRIPSWGTVVTATTDGLLTDVPLEKLDVGGPVCVAFADIRERMFGVREVLDPAPKHAARQLISVAVRTTFTAKRAPGYDLVCAKGSVKPPTRAEPGIQNRHMLKLYLGYQFGMTVEHEQLISAREQITRELDLYGVKRTRKLNFRYDFKRKPKDVREMVLGRHGSRIAWETSAWPDVGAAEFARSRLDGWTRERRLAIRTMAHFIAWEAYFEASVAMKKACEAVGIRTLQIREDNAWGVLMRVFLQAGRQGKWGVSFKTGSLTAIAEIFTAAGFPTSKEHITYAKRRAAPLLPHCVAWVPETKALLGVILQHHPAFEYWEAFCAPEITASIAGALICDGAPSVMTAGAFPNV